MRNLRRIAFLIAALLAAPSYAQVVPFGTMSGGGGGGTTTIISGTTPITGGGSTQVCYNQGGFLKCGDAGLIYAESTDILTMLGGATIGSVTTAGRSTSTFLDTISGASATSNFFNSTGTFNATLSAETTGALFSYGFDNDAAKQNLLKVTATGTAGADSTVGVFDNGTSGGKIFEARANGTATVTIGATGATTINNGSAAVTPLDVQDNGTSYFRIVDGGNAEVANLANVLWTLNSGGSLLFQGGTSSTGNSLSLSRGSGDITLLGTASRQTLSMFFAANSTSAINSGFAIGTNVGASSNGFGNGLLFQGQSSTTTGQSMIQVAGVWSNATHASRTSYAVTQTVAGASALETRRLDGVSLNLTDNTATTFAVMTLGNDTGGGGTIQYCIYGQDATTGAIECGSVDFAGVDVTAGAGGETCSTPGKIGTPLQALNGATLTTTFAATTGTDLCNIRVTADFGAAAPTTLSIKWSASNSGRTLTPQ